MQDPDASPLDHPHSSNSVQNQDANLRQFSQAKSIAEKSSEFTERLRNEEEKQVGISQKSKPIKKLKCNLRS